MTLLFWILIFLPSIELEWENKKHWRKIYIAGILEILHKRVKYIQHPYRNSFICFEWIKK